MKRWIVVCAVLIGTIGVSIAAEKKPVKKTQNEGDAGFAAPGSAAAQVKETAKPKTAAFQFSLIDKALEPWIRWKAKLRRKTGLHIAMAYAYLHQWASDAPPGVDDAAGGGIFRISGSWTLVNRGKRNAGRIVFATDHRHRYTRTAPQGLGFQVGYLGIPGLLFHNMEHTLGELSWQQVLNNGKTWVVIGRYNPNDVFDVLGYANPWTTFQNYAIVLNTSVAMPNYGTGIAASHWFNNQWYLNTGVADINGHPTVNKFFEDFHEVFTIGEIGWAPKRGQRYSKNVHVTAWHADAREAVLLQRGTNIPEGDGIAIGAHWTFIRRLAFFFRSGWSSGGSRMSKKSLAGGLTYIVPSRSDMVGLGMSWSEPSNKKLDAQTCYELFYRVQLSPRLAITPSLQYIDDPALPSAQDDHLWFYGLRGRLTF